MTETYWMPYAPNPIFVRDEDIYPPKITWEEAIDQMDKISAQQDAELAAFPPAPPMPSGPPVPPGPPLPYSNPPAFDSSSWSNSLEPKVFLDKERPPKPEVLDLAPHSYMSTVHNPGRLVECAEMCLENMDFDTLVGTGLSGTLAAVELARKLDKNYLIVRKPDDGTHSPSKFEGLLGKRWVFVDDLVDSGSTFARVYDAVTSASQDRNFMTEYIGAFLYNIPEFSAPTHYRTLQWFYKSEVYDGRFGEAQNPW